ncbi:hypothetical protein CspeluHIS016_0201800 [Cutaneotrichosporon spelunceum]|uniref:Uncharacterized protein n=1 Tax=Cutaneotrichosporon spelunceum TaxID=1672016 RepID=A0AAD3TQX7_9TREE|nr:hypothetical protein CspeluHIS016_0201800 [Cutaneotrichosporon spelunceum]
MDMIHFCKTFLCPVTVPGSYPLGNLSFAHLFFIAHRLASCTVCSTIVRVLDPDTPRVTLIPSERKIGPPPLAD